MTEAAKWNPHRANVRRRRRQRWRSGAGSNCSRDARRRRHRADAGRSRHRCHRRGRSRAAASGSAIGGAGLRGREPGQERLQHDEPSRDQMTGRRQFGLGECGWQQEPLAWHPSTASPPESPAPSLPSGITQRGSSRIRRHGQPRIRAIEITPEVLLKAYACGIFPMAESAEDPALYWIEPEMRGIIPLDGFHVSARLARTVRSDRFTVTVNRDFDGVHRRLCVSRCRAGRAPGSMSASARYTASCTSAGIATASRSIDGDELVGGLYGVTLGRAFFGESMFHRDRDASKVALVHLDGAAAGRRLPLARHAIRHRTSQELRRDRSAAAGNITGCWKRRSVGEADFTALRTDRPVTGAEALALLADMAAHQQP